MDVYDNVDQACRIPDVLQANPKKCASPLCKRYDESYCNGTFYRENGKLDLSVIPRFPESDTLSKIYGVERTFGGGKSGAYLFGICSGSCCSACGDKQQCSIDDKKKQRKFMLKVYPSAFDKNGHVADVGPFTEVYTQCMMSGYQGYTCMVCYGIAQWSSVADLFTRDLNDVPRKCHGDMVGVSLKQQPKQVLFQVTTIAPGTPLLASSLVEHPTKLMGCMLQIMAVWQTARNRMGKDVFTHWDFHPDNIFVDWDCNARPPLEVPTLDTLMRQSQNLFKKVSMFAQLGSRGMWTKAIVDAMSKAMNLTLDSMASILINRKTGLKVHIYGAAGLAKKKSLLEQALRDVRGIVAGMEALGPLQPYVLSIVDQIVAWVGMDTFVKIEYPNVTIIDFDLVTSTKFPEKRPKHLAKLQSALPITERALAFVLTWLPADRAVQWLTMLGTAIKVTRLSLDHAHMLTYAYVLFVYHLNLNIMPNVSINNICGMVTTAWGGAIEEIARLATTMDLQAILSMMQQFAANLTANLTPGLSVVTNHAVTAFGTSMGLRSMGAMGLVQPDQFDAVQKVTKLYTQGRDVVHAALTGEFQPSALANKGIQMLFGAGQTTPVQFMRAIQANLQYLGTTYHQHTRQFPSQESLFLTVFRIPVPASDVTSKGLKKFVNLAQHQQQLRDQTTVGQVLTLLNRTLKAKNVSNLRCTLRYPKDVWMGLLNYMFGEVDEPREPQVDWDYTFLYGFRDTDRSYVPELLDLEREKVKAHFAKYINATVLGRFGNYLTGATDALTDVTLDIMSRRIVLHAQLPDSPADDKGDAPVRVTMAVDGGSTMVIKAHADLYVTIGLDKETDANVCDFAGSPNEVALCADNHEPAWSKSAMLITLGFKRVVAEMYPNGSMAIEAVLDVPPAQGVTEESGVHHVVRWTLKLVAFVQVLTGLARRLGLKRAAGINAATTMLRSMVQSIATKKVDMNVAQLAEYLRPMLVEALGIDKGSVIVRSEGSEIVVKALIPKGDPMHCIGAVSSLFAGDPNLANILDCASFLSPASGFSIMTYLKDMFKELMHLATPNSELAVDLFFGDVAAGLGALKAVKHISKELHKQSGFHELVTHDHLVVHQPLVRTRYNPLTNRYPLELVTPKKQVWGIHTATMVLSAINMGIDSAEKFAQYVQEIEDRRKQSRVLAAVSNNLGWLTEFYREALAEVEAQNGNLHALKSAVTQADQVMHKYKDLAEDVDQSRSKTRVAADFRAALEVAEQEMHDRYTDAVAAVIDSVADVQDGQGSSLARHARHYVQSMLSFL